MKAVIPAAGCASRLRPLTDHCHKAMLPLGNTTMIALILENLNLFGIREIIIITGYRAEALTNYIRSLGNSSQIIFVHNPDFSVTNNAYSLSLAEPFIAGQEFLLLDCDIVFEPNVLERVLGSKHDNVLAVHKRETLGDEEMKVYSEDGRKVYRLSKSEDPKKASGESVGIEKFSAGFSKKLFNVLRRHIEDGRGKTEFYEDAFQELVNKGENIHMADVTDYLVMEVDFKTDLERAKNEILPHLHRIFV
jgi:choline kinase